MEGLVSASLGPMGRLLRQLHSLQARPPDGVSQGEIHDLIKPLEVISDSLKDLSEAEDPGQMANCWMKEARELCYDIEGFLDDSATHAYQHGNDEHMNNVKAEYEILKARAGYAIERLKSNNIDPWSFIKSPFIGRRLAVVDANKIDHGPKDIGIEELLDIGKEEQLKVVSLVGPEGVGKTTLAKTLYNKLNGHFHCRAFLRVSPKPDIMVLLTSLFIQIHKKQPSRSLNAHDLTKNIAEHLRDKRYLILLDDLWSASVWHMISRALPVGECCSRILTTTQIQDVALTCCGYQSKYVLKMEPLNDIQSEKLFIDRALGSEILFYDPDVLKIAYGLMRKCGGLPLSIVNITSLLASEPKHSAELLKHISDSLSTSEGMKEVVKFVYDNLPPRLKTCLLYVSMYPAWYTIVKDDLVKQWMAEEFVNDVQTAKGYFDELVIGGMIQPVDTDDTGEVLTCTVHHLVLDLIANKSMEENFIITLNYFHSTTALPEKVRRVSVQFGGARSANISASIFMCEVRSLFFFGFSDIVPSVGGYKYLQVLAFHIWAHQEKTFDLDRVGVHELLRLRYLKIVCNIPVKLPSMIQRQKHLEILEVYATLVSIPVDIGYLYKLRILKLAVRKLSNKDICSLQTLPALTALSVHVKTAPTENIVIDKGGFRVLDVFTFRCAPNLLIQSNAMPKLQNLKLCFNANEAHQYGTTITIKYLPSLKEISAKIRGSSDEAIYALLSAIHNNEANPVVQLVEFREDKELRTLEEQHENMEEECDETYENPNKGSGGVETHEIKDDDSRKHEHEEADSIPIKDEIADCNPAKEKREILDRIPEIDEKEKVDEIHAETKNKTGSRVPTSTVSSSGGEQGRLQMDKQLLKLAISGDYRSMQAMASYNQSILLGKTPQGNTCLHISSGHGHRRFCAEVLFLEESLLTTINFDEETPLIAAVRNGHVSLASLLLKSCCDLGLSQAILQQDRYGFNALHHAIRNGHKDFAQELITAEPALSRAVSNCNESPLFFAVMRNFTHVYEELMENPLCNYSGGLHGLNCLHAAVLNGDLALVETIMNKHPQLARGVDEDSNTPVTHAVLCGKISILQLMLEYDSNLGYAIDINGTPLLVHAAFRGQVAAAQELLKHCPDAQPYTTENGETLLHTATRNDHAEFVEFVLRDPLLHKLVNMQDDNGKTALHLAVMNCNPRIVVALLSHKDIDTTVLDNRGYSAAWELSGLEENIKSLNWIEVTMLMSKANPREGASLHNFHVEAKQRTKDKSRNVAPQSRTYTSNTSFIAILITTITFAAAFTLPGGYSNNAGSEGLPIMSKKLAFQAFLISDVLAMCSSFVVAFICIIARWEDYEFLIYYQSFTKKLMWFAYISTTTAFSTGLYTVLVPHLSWIAISICVLVAFLPTFTLLLGNWPVLKLKFRLGKNFRSDLLDMV